MLPNYQSTWQRFRALLETILPRNPFYREKFNAAGLVLDELRFPQDYRRIPFTCKSELIADHQQHPPYGSARTFPLEQYCRLHQSSGTSTGQPLRWLDTAADWDWLLHCWQQAFPTLGLKREDRLFFPFSFGPFLGFWSAFEAATRSGYLCLAGGGMSSIARLHFLLEHQVTVVFATPTYALHLAELASTEGINLATSPVRALVVAGEPGGTLQATRTRIESVWGCRVFDHYGLTEVGPVAFETVATPGIMRVLESDFIAEVLTPGGSEPVAEGEVGELVVSNLGRVGSPVIRYRTGDLVRARRRPVILAADSASPADPFAGFLELEGGILGRTDDMIHVRGNNLYPTAIESVIRRFPEIREFRIIVDHTGPLTDLRVEIESANPDSLPQLAEAVGREIRNALLFRVDVSGVPSGSLPRFEMKARRVIHIKDKKP